MNGVGDPEAREIGHEPPEEIVETGAPDVQGVGMDEATNPGEVVENTPTPAAPAPAPAAPAPAPAAPAPLTVNVSLGSTWLQQQQYGNHTPHDLLSELIDNSIAHRQPGYRSKLTSRSHTMLQPTKQSS